MVPTSHPFSFSTSDSQYFQRAVCVDYDVLFSRAKQETEFGSYVKVEVGVLGSPGSLIYCLYGLCGHTAALESKRYCAGLYF